MNLLCGRGPSLFDYGIGLLFLLPFLILFIRAYRNSSIVSRVINHGGLLSEGVEVNLKEYYNAVHQRFKNRKIKIKGMFARFDDLSEGSHFLGTRKYLVIGIADITFYVCTFEVGNAQVFTYWQIAPLNLWQRFIGSIPIIGKGLIALFYPETLYKVDLSSALLSMLETDIKAVTSEFCGQGGFRVMNSGDLEMIREAATS